MDSYGVRRRDTTKGPPLRILSLDGGGVRGYSMFIILQELMHRTFVETEGRAPRRHEIPKPCDHFDLIVGTGTGGLIALMLGRLRLDLETCKELYVRLTRMVFETDKTIAGIPYRHTLFKASRLEEAIRQCVREHTVYEEEGNDGSSAGEMMNPLNAAQFSSAASNPRRHASNASTVSFSARSPTAQIAQPAFYGRGGNSEARLYDSREYRTKTVVTAMYKGSPKGSSSTLLRSYDSRREPPPEFDCKIWQAGRATCAIGLAFKPVQIGQSIFHDDGVGTFNPAPEALDEAVMNEWPGREVGVFLSVGTGKRPKGSDSNQQMWYEGFLGEFADARRRLIAKIEGCEKIHEYLVKDHLTKRGVNVENYYRLNVEIGVGEFGMNEWNRLGEISTGTRRYMAKAEEKKMSESISIKLAKIYKAKIRWDRAAQGLPDIVKTSSSTNLELPLAVELPADTPVLPPTPLSHDSRVSYESGADSLHVGQNNGLSPSPRSSYEQRPETGNSRASPSPGRPVPPPPPGVGAPTAAHVEESDKLVVTAPTPSQFSHASGDDKIAIMSPDEHPRPHSGQYSAPPPTRMEPPPLPPKTPLPGQQQQAHNRPQRQAPPYPIDEQEPPPINMARKPHYRGR